jgi:hypothetical protein
MMPTTTDRTPLVRNPRPGQWDQLNNLVGQIHQARRDGHHLRAAWLYGVQTGTLAAFSGWDLWADDLIRARHYQWSRNEPYDAALERITRLVPHGPVQLDAIRACGVLWGFKEATAEEPDAEECLFCNGRVLLDRDTDAVSTWHGVFCAEQCHRDLDGYECCRHEPEDNR